MAKQKQSKKTATAKSEKKRGLKDKTIYPAWDMQVVKNKVVLKDRVGFDNHLVPLEGREDLQMIIKRKIKPRSRHIEKYYHAVVVRMIAQEMGIEDNEAHEFLKDRFLREEKLIFREDGTPMRYERTMSTTELGDKRYYQYVFDEVIPWAAKKDVSEDEVGLGLYIPMPNEADWDGREYYQHVVHK